MPRMDVKIEALRILDNMPDNITWDDLMNEFSARQAIDAGLGDSDAGRTIDVKIVRAEFGLPE
jgi:hypothetical protein